MAVVRKASAHWEGDLKGHGRVSTRTSDVLLDQPVTWEARAETAGGKTSPEELLAAAHASCFAMALSNLLGKQGTVPERLEVQAAVTFDKVGAGFRVTRSDLEVRGVVPGVDEVAFRRAAEEAKEGCPISQALHGNVELGVTATLLFPEAGVTA